MNNPILTRNDVIEIGNQLFPTAKNGRWGSSFAEYVGLSQATISNILNGAEVSKKTSRIILERCSNIIDNKLIEKIDHVPVYGSNELYTSREMEIADRIGKRFVVAEQLTHSMVEGKIRSMIVSGAAGVGKSYTIERILEESGVDVETIKGSVSAGGLYSTLYNYRDGGIIVIDDADSIFGDEDGMNLLKGALDSSEKRVLSWKKQSSFVYDEKRLSGKELTKAEDAGKIPNSFEFKGSVIFITNIDFAKEAERGSKMSVHFSALMSRSMYLDLTMNTAEDRIVRMKQVFIEGNMYKKENIDYNQAMEIVGFVAENKNRFRDLSLRLIKHICDAFHSSDAWKDVIEVTKMR